MELNTITKVKRLNAGNYEVTVTNGSEIKLVNLTYWNGRRMNEWKYNNDWNFPTKKEALLALLETEWEFI